ncbi:MAG: PIN domain-containing protein [Chthoniobacterales bacterium]
MSALLVDSCWIIDRMRSGEDFRQRLLPALRAGQLYNCGVVRAEVLRGIKLPSMRNEVSDFFDIIPEIPCDAKLWRQVADLGWTLGRIGKWPPVTDLTIAVCAKRVGATVITSDAHFREIPDLEIREDL